MEQQKPTGSTVIPVFGHTVQTARATETSGPFLGLSDVQPSERLKARRNRSDSVALSPIHRSILLEVLENP